jgi:hypothetical protein
MRRRLSIAAILLATASAGCGATSDSTPVACLEGPGSYLTALKGAPGAVELPGGTPISGCLVENQKAGDLAAVGGALVTVATRLNAEARAEPGGAANLRLGYLLGAAERGAEGTSGIHADLIRRLTAAARYSPDGASLPATFLRTYQRGFEAGEAHG